MPPQPEIETMDQRRSDKPEGAPACARNADAGASSGGAGPERRLSARRKLAAVARLSGWRDRVLVAAEAAMNARRRRPAWAGGPRRPRRDRPGVPAAPQPGA